MQLNTLPADALAPIRARFLASLRERETRVREALASACAAEPDALLDDVHKIRGVAPMLGLVHLGARAAETEDRLDLWLRSAPPAAATSLRLPEDLMHALHHLHSAIHEALA